MNACIKLAITNASRRHWLNVKAVADIPIEDYCDHVAVCFRMLPRQSKVSHLEYGIDGNAD